MLSQVDVIKQYVIRAMLCGSRVTCNPPPTDTDQDVIVLVGCIRSSVQDSKAEGWRQSYAEVDEMHSELELAGFVLGGSGDGEDAFESWTLGEVNLILTADNYFYNRFVTATTVCRRLNVMGKMDRQVVFQAILYGNPAYLADETGAPASSIVAEDWI